jgi:predicted nuclease of predicted toxin-antitoxin system
MNNVLLDKNAGSRKLRDSCNEQGIVQCFLLPKAIRDTATDPDVAEFAVEHDDFILTFDRGFCDGQAVFSLAAIRVSCFSGRMMARSNV